MPLKLVPPRVGKTPYWYVRGAYLGRHLDRSTKARTKPVARAVLRQWQRQIERGEFSAAADGPLSFAAAALAYMQAIGDGARIAPLLEHFKDTPAHLIDQVAIDAAAAAIMPNASPQTRNREIYTPVSAVLKRAGIAFEIKRPEGWRGRAETDWLSPPEAFAALAAAKTIDAEFWVFLTVLLYTGLRLSEATVHFQIKRLDLSAAYAYVPRTKNGSPRAVFLPPVAVAALASHPRGLERPGETVFRFRKNGRLYALLARVAKASGRRLTFHLFRHTYGAWMRRYGGLDTSGLIATGTWKDPASVRRYEHVIASEESAKAMLLPVEKTWKTPAAAAKRLKTKRS